MTIQYLLLQQDIVNWYSLHLLCKNVCCVARLQMQQSSELFRLHSALGQLLNNNSLFA